MMQYLSDVETKLGEQNHQLSQQVHDLQLDVENATQSRRTLQHTLQQLKVRVEELYEENERLKVSPPELSTRSAEAGLNLWQHNNPYVLALIDGDGLIVSSHLQAWLSRALTGR
jgi:phosphatidate phosphatase PAH1